MRAFRLFLCLLAGVAGPKVVIHAQTTSSCFEIESILVDACAPETPTREGLNEMVRFLVGPNSLNVSDLSVTWATGANAWQGICRNATTASKVAQLNASITSCGQILEPPGGILPANSKVILVTSADMDVAFNSFAGLQETIYMIFQCGAETNGHFANYNASPGIRTLSMRFQAGCNDQVSYDRTKLIDQDGNVGGGPPGVNLGDGATVNFAFNGTASYANDGCMAPIIPLSAEWDVPPALCAGSPSIDLNDFLTGTAGGTWSGNGVSGSQFNPSGLNGNISVTYKVGPPGCEVLKTQDISVLPQANATWTNPGPLCSTSGLVNLNALVSGTPGGTWSGSGVSGSQFNPAGQNSPAAVTYTVGTGGCAATLTLQITITATLSADWNAPGAVCDNAAALNLNALITGAPGGTWSGNGVSGNTFSPIGLSGAIQLTYTVGSGACQTSKTHPITVNPTPAAPGPVTGRTSYCNEAPEALQVNPQAGATVEWYSDASLSTLAGAGTSFTPPAGVSATYYVVQVKNGCKSAATAVSVLFNAGAAPPTLPDTVHYCQGSAIPEIVATGTTGTVIWYNDQNLTNEIFRGNAYTPAEAPPAALYVIAESNGCRSTATVVHFKQGSAVSIKISPTGPITLCKNESVTLQSNQTSGNIWSTGSTSQNIVVSQAGNYKVRTEGFCGASSDSITVLSEAAIAGFSLNPPGGAPPIDIKVTETSLNATQSTWLLDGVPINLSGENYQLHFDKEGLYVLTLRVSNASGCTDTISRTIRVYSDFVSLYIPNTFSPNGDGHNDVFRIYSTGLTEVTVSIFNRWGNELYRYKDPEGGWDGFINQQEIEEGMYVYRVQARDIMDRGINRIGRILLIK